jgi:sugar lactone lactonase YvrE
MIRRPMIAIPYLLSLLWTVDARAFKVSLLIDLDPNSAAQTVVVESIAADAKGRLYACDRVSGNVWRIDPKDPKLVVVGRVQEREIGGKKVRADVSGIVFNQAGDLYLTASGFKEVLPDHLENLWVAANERNAVVLVQPGGKVYDVHKNDSKGPLEFPTSVVFVDATAYVSKFDTPRRDNLAADGKTSLDGIGASIVKIEQ